jgi:hypothetical protein
MEGTGQTREGTQEGTSQEGGQTNQEGRKTTATKPEQVTPELDLKLFNTTTLIGLETLGAVRVLFETVSLGVPSFMNETVFEPFKGVQIIVPAGAWLTSKRRGGSRPLTISVFELPSELSTPGVVAGPAIDLGPHDQLLARAISVRLPLYSRNYTTQPNYEYYSLDPSSLSWKMLDISNESFVATSVLGASVAFIKEGPVANSNNNNHYYIAGAMCGAAVVVLLIFIAYQRRRSRRAKCFCYGKGSTTVVADLAFA